MIGLAVMVALVIVMVSTGSGHSTDNSVGLVLCMILVVFADWYAGK